MCTSVRCFLSLLASNKALSSFLDLVSVPGCPNLACHRCREYRYQIRGVRIGRTLDLSQSNGGGVLW